MEPTAILANFRTTPETSAEGNPSNAVGIDTDDNEIIPDTVDQILQRIVRDVSNVYGLGVTFSESNCHW